MLILKIVASGLHKSLIANKDKTSRIAPFFGIFIEDSEGGIK